MTVYLPKGRRAYRFDFEWRGKRYVGSTGMSRVRDAEEFERKYRVSLERQAGDLSLRAAETPRFHDWAEVFYTHKTERQRLKRPELLEREINVILEFCGPRPTAPAPAPTRKNPPPRRMVPVQPPYHDLRLGDFIEHPEWITEFEQWLRARGTGGSARNHYRSVMSGLYKIAMLPEYRRATGIRSNPFAGIERDRPIRRRVTLTVAQLQTWIAHAAPHVRLALAIGALAPALRRGSVLGLRWGEHVHLETGFLTITDHKGDRAQSEPLSVPISAQLASILASAKATWERAAARPGGPKTDYVIQFRKKPVKSITVGLRKAAQRAGLDYGVQVAGGATYHALRHTMATMLATLGVPEAHRKELLAHQDIATTQIYTHLHPMHLVQPLEQLSGVLPIEDIVTAKGTAKAVGKTAGPVGTTVATVGGHAPAHAKQTRGANKEKRSKNRRRSASHRRAS